MKRVVTAAILIPIALYAIFWAPGWFFNGVALALGCLCFHEFTRIASGHGIEGPLWLGYIVGAGIMSGYAVLPLSAVLLLTVGLTLSQMRQVLLYAAAVLLGSFYVFVPWRCALDLHAANAFWVLYALAINWVGDVAAYYTGRAFGRHKLAPIVSPGKSWEGAAGSLVLAVLFGIFLARQTNLPISGTQMMVLSVLVNIAGQLGDLAESALKRGANVKDSGTLLPGHGGFLDRLDSSLFTLPVVYYGVTQTALLQLLP